MPVWNNTFPCFLSVLQYYLFGDQMQLQFIATFLYALIFFLLLNRHFLGRQKNRKFLEIMARTPRGQAPSQAKKNQASTKAAAKNSKISKPKKKSGATPAKAEKAKAKSGGQPAQQQPKPKEDKKNVTVDGFDDGVPSRRSSDRRKTAVDR